MMDHIPMTMEDLEAEGVFGANRMKANKYFKDFLESDDDAWMVTEWLNGEVNELTADTIYSSVRYYACMSELPVRIIKRTSHIYLVRR